MRESVKIVELDRSEQGAYLTAVNDLRNKRLADGKSTATVDGLIAELYSAPTKRRKIKEVSAESCRDFVERGGATERASFRCDNSEMSKQSPRRRGEAR